MMPTEPNRRAPRVALKEPDTSEGEPIRINGFEQVVEMLRAADPAFRESLLRRIANQDRKLAESLRSRLV